MACPSEGSRQTYFATNVVDCSNLADFYAIIGLRITTHQRYTYELAS